MTIGSPVQQCKHKVLPNDSTIVQGAKSSKQNNKTYVFYDYFTSHTCKRKEGMKN